MARPSLDQYFMDMTHLVKARGTCPRRQVGAVVVKDKRVLTTGYNGAPRNFPHPIDTGCMRDELQIPRGMMADVCPCLHAEQNAILQAATTGVSIDGADLYCTTQPCTQCSRMIANAGIRRVCFAEEYPDPLAIGILTTAGVESWIWDAGPQTLRPYGNTNTFEQAQDALREKWRQERPDLVPKSPLLRPEHAVPETAAPSDAEAEPPGPPGPPGASDQEEGRLPHDHLDRDRALSRPSDPETGPDQDQGQEVSETPHQAAKQRPPGTSAARMRDLTDAPDREEVIRRLAREKAERIRKARQEAGL